MPVTSRAAARAAALFATLCATATAGLAGEPAHEHPHAAPAGSVGTVAVARLSALGGSGVSGTVTFEVVDRAERLRTLVHDVVAQFKGASIEKLSVTTTEKLGVRVRVEIDGLVPGKHGFHVHEWGDCSAADGASAGGHYNPHGTAHGDIWSDARHPGDFGNLVADEKGHATLDACCFDFTLGPGPTNILGRSVIVHGGVDDLITQPSGNSGPRIACGLIELQGGATEPVKKPTP
jgi:Cu-Zn family superoxide dismutase